MQDGMRGPGRQDYEVREEETRRDPDRPHHPRISHVAHPPGILFPDERAPRRRKRKRSGTERIHGNAHTHAFRKTCTDKGPIVSVLRLHSAPDQRPRDATGRETAAIPGGSSTGSPFSISVSIVLRTAGSFSRSSAKARA